MPDRPSQPATPIPLLRPQAVAEHERGRRAIALPRLAVPGARVAWWALLALLVAGLVIASMTRVPRLVPASGTIVRDADGRAQLLVLAPPAERARLNSGMRVRVQLPNRQGLVEGRVTGVDPAVRSPAELRKRYAGARADMIAAGPSLVLTARVDEPLGGGASEREHEGDLVMAHLEVARPTAVERALGSGGG